MGRRTDRPMCKKVNRKCYETILTMKQLHGLTRFDFNKNGQCDYILGFSGFHEPDPTSSSSLDLDPSYSSLPLDIARLLMIQAILSSRKQPQREFPNPVITCLIDEPVTRSWVYTLPPAPPISRHCSLTQHQQSAQFFSCLPILHKRFPSKMAYV
jgi:hypothetical protein